MLVYILVVVFLVVGDAKRFETDCDLVYELRRQKFPENLMQDWVCLIDNESNRTTNVISPANRDGSRDYGLFQINDKWWCNKGSRPGKECNITCADLLTDDIAIASRCAKQIYNRNKFYAWHAWRDFCQQDCPDISHC